jgi:hypothetical protein
MCVPPSFGKDWPAFAQPRARLALALEIVDRVLQGHAVLLQESIELVSRRDLEQLAQSIGADPVGTVRVDGQRFERVRGRSRPSSASCATAASRRSSQILTVSSIDELPEDAPRPAVRIGRVQLDAELPEGASVTVLAPDAGDTFVADPETEKMLLKAIDQCRRGQVTPFKDFVAEMRTRE